MTITIPGATEWGIEVLVFPPLGVNGAPCGCDLALVGRFARQKEMLLDIEQIRFIVPCYFFGRCKCSKPLGRCLPQSAFGFCLINLPQIVLILNSLPRLRRYFFLVPLIRYWIFGSKLDQGNPLIWQQA